MLIARNISSLVYIIHVIRLKQGLQVQNSYRNTQFSSQVHWLTTQCSYNCSSSHCRNTVCNTASSLSNVIAAQILFPRSTWSFLFKYTLQSMRLGYPQAGCALFHALFPDCCCCVPLVSSCSYCSAFCWVFPLFLYFNLGVADWLIINPSWLFTKEQPIYSCQWCSDCSDNCCDKCCDEIPVDWWQRNNQLILFSAATTAVTTAMTTTVAFLFLVELLPLAFPVLSLFFSFFCWSTSASAWL